MIEPLCSQHRGQINKRNFVIKKRSLTLDSLTVHYFNLDNNSSLIPIEVI
jgi:hypothetical protein